MESNDKKHMAPQNDNYQRWQKITIDQLTYVLNLILTFTVATLGYWFVLLTDKDFSPNQSAKWFMIVVLPSKLDSQGLSF